MNKAWLVGLHEYKRNVFKKSFLLVLLSVPAIIAFGIGLGIFIESTKNNPLPAGYVDHAGILPDQADTPGVTRDEPRDQNASVQFISYPTETEARTALEAGSIQAYYLLPSDYAKTREVEIVYIEEPGSNIGGRFIDLLRLNLLAAQSPEIAYRAAVEPEVIVRSLDGRREVSRRGPHLDLLTPLFINIAFLFMLGMSSGYTMGAFVDEKENRTMEVMVTSVSPIQLVTGKILAVIAISLTLLLTWTCLFVLGVFIAHQAGFVWFSGLSLDWRGIFSSGVIVIPAYILALALMTAVGSISATTREGQSISALFVMLHLVPLYIIWAFINNPHGLLAVLLSLLPFTALLTVGLRNLVAIVPLWQVAVSAVLQTIYALGALWLAGRAFRLGMLKYGQRLAWSRLFRLASERRRHA